MSGVMIKTGIYGLLRALTFLGAAAGLVGLAAGRRRASASGVLGVLFALAQHDLKRLLAYHSVENIGIIALGLGVGPAGRAATASPALAVLGFAGGAAARASTTRSSRACSSSAPARCCTPPARARSTTSAACSSACRWTGATFLVGAGGHLRPAAAQRLRQRVPDLPRRLPRACCTRRGRRGRAGAGGARRARADRRAGGRLLRQGLRHRLPRRAAQRAAPRTRTSPGCAMRLPMVVLAAACVARRPGAARCWCGAWRGALAAADAAARGRDRAGAGGRASLPLARVTVAAAVLLALAAALALLAAARCSPAGRSARRSPGTAATPRPPRACSTPPRPSPSRSRCCFGGFLRHAHRAGRRRRASSRSRPRSPPRRPTSSASALFRPAFRWRRGALAQLRWLQHGRVQLYVLYIAADAAGAAGLEAAMSHAPPSLPSAARAAAGAAAARASSTARKAGLRRAGRARRCCSPTSTSASCCARARSTAAPRPGCSAPGRWSASPRWRPPRCSCRFGGAAAPLAFPGDLVLLCLPAGADALLHRARRARHRLELRGHGRQPRGAVLRAGRAGAAAGAGRAGARHRAACRSAAHVRGADAGGLGARGRRRWCWCCGALFVVFLAENARIPVDDPNTHLELTMIHEVMVLDHGGPDLGAHPVRARRSSCGCSARCWSGSRCRCGASCPGRAGSSRWRGCWRWPCWWASSRSVMARLQLVRVPQLLVGATALSVLAIVLVMRG